MDDSGLERRRAEEEERLAGKYPAQVSSISVIMLKNIITITNIIAMVIIANTIIMIIITFQGAFTTGRGRPGPRSRPESGSQRSQVNLTWFIRDLNYQFGITKGPKTGSKLHIPPAKNLFFFSNTFPFPVLCWMACSIGEGILGIWNVGGSKYRQMFRFFFSQFAFSWIHKCLFAKYSHLSPQLFSTPTMLILR